MTGVVLADDILNDLDEDFDDDMEDIMDGSYQDLHSYDLGCSKFPQRMP